jgi:hypothetical protein
LNYLGFIEAAEKPGKTFIFLPQNQRLKHDGGLNKLPLTPAPNLLTLRGTTGRVKKYSEGKKMEKREKQGYSKLATKAFPE